MALWKQLVLATFAAAAVLAGWFVWWPDTLPGAMVRWGDQAIVAVGLEPPQRESAAPAAGRGGPGGPGGPGRGRGRPSGPTRVLTSQVEEARSQRRVESLGSAEAERSVTLFPPTGGLVVEVGFRAGDSVDEGQPILQLDSREQKIAIEKVQIRLKTAEEQVNRFQRLARTQAVTGVQLETAQSAVATARSELAAAELDLERRVLRAPFSGVLGFPRVEVGDLVTTTTPVAHIDDLSTIYVRFAVPERYAEMAKVGTPVTATTAAHGDQVFAGEIESLDSRIDPQARTITVRARITTNGGRLRPGLAMAVRVDFLGEAHNAVPRGAVQWDRDGSFVWKVDDGRAVRVPVTIVERADEFVLVKGDLTVSDHVVTEGVQGLREGTQVQPIGGARQARN